MEIIDGARVYGVPENVAIAHNVPDDADDGLRRNGFSIYRDLLKDKPQGDELVKRFNDKGIDAVITRTTVNATADVLRRTGISMISAACVQPRVDLLAARELGIVVTRVQENSDQVRRLTMSAIGSFSTGMLSGTLDTRAGRFRKDQIGKGNFHYSQVRLGVAGGGKIAKAVMENARREGMKVAFYNDRSSQLREADMRMDLFAEQHGIQRMDSLMEVAEWCNIFSVHAAEENLRGERNDGLINRALFDAIRRNPQPLNGAFFINNARRELIDQATLPWDIFEEALRDGTLAGFATDVFDKDQEEDGVFEYPFKESWPNVITTPHVGGSCEYLEGMAAKEAARKLNVWTTTGSFTGSLTVQGDKVDVQPAPGQLALCITRGTDPDIDYHMKQVLSENGLSYTAGGQETTGDHVVGEPSVERQIAHHVLRAKGVSAAVNDDFLRIASNVVGQLCALNRGAKKPIKSVRVIATDSHQRELLHGVKFAPNLTET